VPAGSRGPVLEVLSGVTSWCVGVCGGSSFQRAEWRSYCDLVDESNYVDSSEGGESLQLGGMQWVSSCWSKRAVDEIDYDKVWCPSFDDEKYAGRRGRFSWLYTYR
jgi:hypothetical protein